jgi:hypothetical protein
MIKEQASAANYALLGSPAGEATNQDSRTMGPKKKKASWPRTILWMLSMVILVNILMAIIAYVLHLYKII